jgi:hypothetical protein
MYQRGCCANSSIVSGGYPRSSLGPVSGGRWSAYAALAAALLVLAAVTGCVRQTEPAPVIQRSTPPPWSAPRDAVAYIEAAGLKPQPVSNNQKSGMIELRITVDGAPVEVPANIGVDRLRALHAVVHTHDTSGRVWLEGPGSDDVTLGQFFTLWGVRFDDHCLGSACGDMVVKVNGVAPTDPREVRLTDSRTIEVSATS